MKKAGNKPRQPESQESYDFSGGVRGKYATRYAEGTNVVRLDPDVAKAFPSAADVNESLRALDVLLRLRRTPS